MRIATAMQGLHYVLHSPQGDTYADLLVHDDRASRPATARHLYDFSGAGPRRDTAQLLQSAVLAAYERHRPQAMLVGASCTAELLQDDPGGLARALNLPVPIVALELPAYQRKENWAQQKPFIAWSARSRRRVGFPVATVPKAASLQRRDAPAAICSDPRHWAFGIAMMSARSAAARPLRHRYQRDSAAGATPADLARLGAADFNVVLYPETARPAAEWLEKTFSQPWTRTVPIGIAATRAFIAEVAALAQVNADEILAAAPSRLPWYSRSVDSNYLTGKRVFIFGDATHAIAAARIAADELGFCVVGLGSYSREHAREVREAAALYGLEALITDDYLSVEAAVTELQPELVLGTQMERHIAKRLRIPCAVISAPIHVQDFPARYAPQMGWKAPT